MMRTIVIAYMGIYIVAVLVSALYSFLKTKKMNGFRFCLTMIALAVVVWSLLSYAKGYQAIQMVGFALSFTSISSLFLYNSLVGENNKFFVMFGLSFFRLIIHVQLLLFLYLFR